MHLSLVVYITMVQFLLIILLLIISFLTHPIIVPYHCYNLSLLFLLIYNIIITNYHSCWCQIKDWHLLSPQLIVVFVIFYFCNKMMLYLWTNFKGLSINYTRANWQTKSSTSYELGRFAASRQRFPVHSWQMEGPTKIAGVYSVGQWQWGVFFCGIC